MTNSNATSGDSGFRLKENKDSMYELTYAGALSFCRRKYSRNLNGVDVVVSGIPYDNAVTNRPGTRLGPRAI
jgi:agmatinase